GRRRTEGAGAGPRDAVAGDRGRVGGGANRDEGGRQLRAPQPGDGRGRGGRRRIAVAGRAPSAQEDAAGRSHRRKREAGRGTPCPAQAGIPKSGGPGRRLTAQPASGSPWAAGSSITKRAPPPSRSSYHRLPSYSDRMCLASDRPSPLDSPLA